MAKSRSDDTLLTVDAIYGQYDVRHCEKSRRDDTFPFRMADKVSSLRDLEDILFRLLRRLKPPVNKVSSLCDFAAEKTIRQYVSDTTPNQKS